MTGRLIAIALMVRLSAAPSARAADWTRLGTFSSAAVEAADGRIVAGQGDHGLADAVRPSISTHPAPRWRSAGR
jgi:hypothetical protein